MSSLCYAFAMRFFKFSMGFLGGFGCATLVATTAAGTNFEIVPKVGYALNMSQDLAGPRYDRLSHDHASLYGLSIGYLTDDHGQGEVSWTHSNTTAHLDQSAGNPADVFDAGIDQIHLNGLYIADASNVQPFALIGVGVTRYSSKAHSDSTRFSFAAGGGVKWLWGDHFGLRLEGKLIPTWAPRGTHLYCPDGGSGGCPSTESNSYFGRRFPFISTVEFTSGLIFRY